MRNRAKCRLCGSVIESFHSTDIAMCKCTEIYVEGGKALLCGAKSWENFLRVDEKGNEIPIKVVEAEEKDNVKPLYKDIGDTAKPTKAEIVQMIDNMISDIERLPDNAKYQPVNHYDLMCSLLLISAAFKSS